MMSNNLTNMLNYWKQLDFEKLQKDLDIDATELAQKQDESELSRKQLVELSREFKKTTSDDLRKVVSPLLKSFQAEIDSLSRRSKNAEAVFLSIYKKIVEMADPTPVLEYAQQLQKKVHKLQDVEVENKQLRDRLEEYNSEFADVKNQEVTIKQLREKVKELDEKMETNTLAKLKEKERELNKQFSEKEKSMHEARMALAKQLGEAEYKANTLQLALNSLQSELFDMKSRHDEVLTAKSDEIELLMTDLERANERALAAERMREEMQQELIDRNDPLLLRQSSETDKRIRDSEQIYDILKRSSLEVELAAKEKEVVQLVEDVQRLQQLMNKTRDAGASQVGRLEEELAMKNKSLLQQKQMLQDQSDYYEIKHELSILKSLEFPEETVIDESASKSLETLLLEKNRALLSENTMIKLSNTELLSKHTKLCEDYKEASTSLQEHKQLVAQLEEDLQSVNALSVLFRGDAEGEDVTPTNQSSEIVASLMKETQLPILNMTMKKSAADGLLPIVQSQRERFRLRAQELETLSMSQQQQIQLLQNEIDKLRSDNVKLYEKIKFLQGYTKNKPIEILTDDTDSRYSSQYDQRLDPFTTFSRKEKLKRYFDLKPYDKITLSLGRFIMGSKTARTVAFFYSLLLHVFVFLVLYKFAYITSCQRDNYAEDWHKKFADHMHDAHNDAPR